MTDIVDTVLIQAETLHRFMQAVFETAGVPAENARYAADVLLWASLRGVDTHGIRNLKKLYIDHIDRGSTDPLAIGEVEYETPVSMRINGQGGLGLVTAHWAMRRAIEKAKESGLCLVTIHNSNHLGAAGFYPSIALEAGMIGVGMTGYFFGEERSAGVLPIFGLKPMLSTNPLSVAFPTAEEIPFVMDMATSIVPFNRIQMMRDAGQSIPLGWGLDAQGQPTTDPDEIKFLFPLGGTREYGGHKGYSLGLMVAVLCAVLSGGWSEEAVASEAAQNTDHDANYQAGYKQRHFAHFLGAIRVDLFRPLDAFKRDMDALIRAVHAAEAAPGYDQIYIPGEVEHNNAQRRQIEGIPVPPTVIAEMRGFAERFQIPLPEPLT